MLGAPQRRATASPSRATSAARVFSPAARNVAAATSRRRMPAWPASLQPVDQRLGVRDRLLVATLRAAQLHARDVERAHGPDRPVGSALVELGLGLLDATHPHQRSDQRRQQRGLAPRVHEHRVVREPLARRRLGLRQRPEERQDP